MTDITLTGTTVELQPLQREHSAALLRAAADGQLWNLKVTNVPGPDTVEEYIDVALAARDAGTAMPFTIVRRDTGQVVGSTRFWKVDRVNRKLEIGHTWLSESMQKSGINTEAKLLLLTYAFEVMACVRVQFTTDELNEKSRALPRKASSATNASCPTAASATRCASALSIPNGRR